MSNEHRSRRGSAHGLDHDLKTPPPPSSVASDAESTFGGEDDAPAAADADATRSPCEPAPNGARRDTDPLRGAWEEDYLLQLAARAELRREDSPFYTDAALVAWIDRESRAPERAAGGSGWGAAQVARVAERVRERAEAARLRVAVPVTPPPLRAAGVVGTVPQVGAAAAAAQCAPAIALAAAAGAGRALWDEPCDQWLELPSDVDAGEYVALHVSGDSMAPLFRSGDTVLVRLGRRVERDSVVVARHPDDGYVVKRVGRLGRTSLELTSLNPAYPPLTIPRMPDTVVGTVVMRWRGDPRPRTP